MPTKREILDAAKKQDVSSLRLQFTDILGVNKNVEVPESQFEKALEGDIMFDGSSFAGCTRQTLKRQIAKAKTLGYEMMAGVEAEFFIFQLDAGGEPTTITHD